MEYLAIYNSLKAAVIFGWEYKVSKLLWCAAIDDIHDDLCNKLPEHASACVSCDALLQPPLRQRDIGMIKLLLEHGAYPSVEICASTEFRYGRREKASTPLKRAVESGSLDYVRRLLAAGADTNEHPRVCLKIERFYGECSDCDTPLMVAARRRDVTMIRLLIAHGANVSAVIHTDGEHRLNKTVLLVAATAATSE